MTFYLKKLLAGPNDTGQTDFKHECFKWHVVFVEQMECLLASVNLLYGQCGNALTRIKRLFPQNMPSDGVGKFVCLFVFFIQFITL